MWLSKLGLCLNIAGTIMVAMSFGKNLNDSYETDKNDRKKYLASFLHPKLFRLGLGIMIIGFIFQFIELKWIDKLLFWLRNQ